MVNNNFEMLIESELLQMNDENMNDENQEIDTLLNVSDEEIQESMKLAEKAERKAGRPKKKINIQADALVDDFLATKSEKSWTALQEFFWYGIKQYAFGFVKNNDDAYDMTIETFINAFNKIDSYDPNVAKFSTWLWTICRNNCLGFIKNQAKLNIVDNDIADIYDSEMVNRSQSYIQNISEFENGVFNGAEFTSSDFSDITKELYDVSVAEMSHIPGIGGRILHMKLVDGKKIREIADELSMNESTVKNYLYRGKENLKRILTINHKDLVDTYVDMNGALDLCQFGHY